MNATQALDLRTSSNDIAGTLLAPRGNNIVVAQRVVPKDGISFHLPELYRMLECEMIEVIHCNEEDMILIIDEEGKFKEYNPINAAATALVTLFDFDPGVVGIALYCHTSLLK